MTTGLLVLLALGGLSLFTVAGVLLRLIYICPPNAVLVFSGSRGRIGDRMVGYRIILGGRAIRIPLLERVDTLNLTNMGIDIRVVGAYSRGGIPLVEGGKIIGAIGASGGTGSQDEVVAMAGAATVNKS